MKSEDKRVMLDFDLAELYGTETKYLKRSVKNNLKRFPIGFHVRVDKRKSTVLRCKKLHLKPKKEDINRYTFAFTGKVSPC